MTSRLRAAAGRCFGTPRQPCACSTRSSSAVPAPRQSKGSARSRHALAIPSSSLLSRRAHHLGERLDIPIGARMISLVSQRTVVSLIDDLDGESEADETVEYALDGVTYEMDLSSQHAERLREVFAPYVAAARRTGGRARSGTSRRRRSSGGGGSASSAGGRGREALKAIRDWAKSSGWAVSARGRLPIDVVEAYDAAHK
jgi:Lsr2